MIGPKVAVGPRTILRNHVVIESHTRLGADNVLGLFMPSPYTAQESGDDVADLTRRIGMAYDTISITPAFDAYRQSLAASFSGRPVDTTEENLQARIRGNLLMAFSNKFGHLVLTTVHANNVFDVIGRFASMGIDAYNFLAALMYRNN